MELSSKARLLKERMALWMLCSAALVVFACLVAIVGTIVVKG